jgi:hypothetical protein
VSVRLFQKRLAFESVDCVNIALTSMGGQHPVSEGPTRTKGQGEANLSSSGAGTSIFSHVCRLVPDHEVTAAGKFYACNNIFSALKKFFQNIIFLILVQALFKDGIQIF